MHFDSLQYVRINIITELFKVVKIFKKFKLYSSSVIVIVIITKQLKS